MLKRSKGNDCLFGLINASIIPNDIDEEEKMEILAELKTSKIKQELFLVSNHFADELDTFFRHIKKNMYLQTWLIFGTPR